MSTASAGTDIAPFNRNVVVAILIAGAFVAVLNQTLLLVAISPIMRDFDISANMAQWVTTAFMLTSGIMIPISAALIDKFSSRTLYLAALSLFILGTLLGALAQSFPILLLARVIQGASAGIIMPLIQTVLMTIFPPEKRGAAMGLAGLVIAFAPAIGPSLSGWLIDNHSWRFLFIVLLPIASVVLLGAFLVMKNVTAQRESRIDPWSVTLSTLGWGGLLYGFSLAGTNGWASSSVWGAIVVGVVSLSVFIPRQLRMDRPMLEFRVFSSSVFTLTTVLSVLVFMLLIGPQTLLPLYTQNVRGFSAFQTGLMLLPGAVVMGIMSPLAGRLFDRFGIKWLAVSGFTLIALAMVSFFRLGMDTSVTSITIGFCLHMLGISTLMMPLITAGINATPLALIAHATAMVNTLRMVGASIGTALLITIMSATAALTTDQAAELSLLDGIRAAFLVALVIAGGGWIVAWQLRRNPRRPRPDQ